VVTLFPGFCAGEPLSQEVTIYTDATCKTDRLASAQRARDDLRAAHAELARLVVEDVDLEAGAVGWVIASLSGPLTTTSGRRHVRVYSLFVPA
jgi:hypothetical protein